MSTDCIPRGTDGFYHPASEDELVCLVKQAYREGRELRVRGSAHSVSHAIYTDPQAGMRNHVEQQSPPRGKNLNVMLDRYISFRVIDRERKLVECDAGIHLGKDPSDPTGTSTWENSLLYQLFYQYGWTLGDTGGITHQTVSGFTATGSSGGSLQFSANQNLYGFRIIDGTGQVYEASRDADPDLFWAMSPNLGLLGVVSKITLECEETFNLSGQEAITTIPDCAIDLFGEGNGKPTLEQFLKEVEYTRLEWWPQRGGERILVWQAQRMKPQLGFIPTRYQEFTNRPGAAEVAISIFYTIIGNLADLNRAKRLLLPTWKELGEGLALVVEALHLPEWAARVVTAAAALGVNAFIDALKPFAHEIQVKLPQLFPKVLEIFEPLDSSKKGMSKGEPQSFRDWAWQGLPMDNQANDVLVPTEFTEAWVPVQHATRVMQLLNAYFTAPADADEALRRTGTYAWELYGAEPTQFWMNCSHSDGADEWKDGVYRIDLYWFANNPGDPAEVFYPQFWNLLRGAGVPFRLHWGKFQPVYAQGDRNWVDFFRAQYPRWDDFLELRRKKDPNNLFLNEYWRARFGLWDVPRPQPMPGAVQFTTIADPAPHQG
jgi:D-arabinono-1,4-lactone oxidase